jgi:alcohol dehydrogenase class IV
METLVTAALADPCCTTNPMKPEAQHVRQILRQVQGHG